MNLEDVLQDPNDVYSLKDIVRGRLGNHTILYDKTFLLQRNDTFDNTGAPVQAQQVWKKLNISIPLRAVSRYNATAGTVADCQSNGLFLVMLSDSGVVDHPDVVGNYRVAFVG